VLANTQNFQTRLLCFNLVRITAVRTDRGNDLAFGPRGRHGHEFAEQRVVSIMLGTGGVTSRYAILGQYISVNPIACPGPGR